MSESQAHNSDTGGLFQVSKQKVLGIPPPLSVAPELIISWAVPALCSQMCWLCVHKDRFKMDEIFRNIKFLGKIEHDLCSRGET